MEFDLKSAWRICYVNENFKQVTYLNTLKISVNTDTFYLFYILNIQYLRRSAVEIIEMLLSVCLSVCLALCRTSACPAYFVMTVLHVQHIRQMTFHDTAGCADAQILSFFLFLKTIHLNLTQTFNRCCLSKYKFLSSITWNQCS